MKRSLLFTCLGVCFSVTAACAATQPELRELPVFASSNHVLDIQVIATARPIHLGEVATEGWVYTVCYRKDALGDACPDNPRTSSEYGGMWLKLQQGDHLKIHFLNQLPPAPPDADHLNDPMGAMLAANPTNLHTHGLIVEPRRATAADPTFGDYVYVLAYPPGKKPGMTTPGLETTERAIDYDIYIPQDHPSGAYWIHPHVHGLALNQLSYGLAGVITVGSPEDYLAGPGVPAGLAPGVTVRNMLLKDIEVRADGTVLSQEDPGFCNPTEAGESSPRDGACPGQSGPPGAAGPSYAGGNWFFTINGQVYPTIHVSPQGEIWRIWSASGSRTYQLQLQDPATGKSLPFQVLAVDGITLDWNSDPAATARATGGKVRPVTCPAHLAGTRAVCANSLHMMPSARAEIWIPPAAASRSAVLVTDHYSTGPAGDDWPYVQLAAVEFPAQPAGKSGALTVRPVVPALLAKTGILGSKVKIDGGPAGELALDSASQTAAKLAPASQAQLLEHLLSLSAPANIQSAPCESLPPGHRRRIFFGLPASNPDGFGLGYEEADAKGRPVPGTFRDIAPFDPAMIDVCLPLAAGNATATEVWELVNVSGEDHNFHIHQTKFRVLGDKPTDAPPDALMDNVPLPHGSDPCDGSIATWRSGSCKVAPVLVSIPFSEVGDFVYHCHILEHEDGGMMAHIRVVPAK
ncbi:copper oxidase [Acidobacteria bacterium AB60]|nr:copper oxidase [Acidobacteria bacterium AB60]